MYTEREKRCMALLAQLKDEYLRRDEMIQKEKKIKGGYGTVTSGPGIYKTDEDDFMDGIKDLERIIKAEVGERVQRMSIRDMINVELKDQYPNMMPGTLKVEVTWLNKTETMERGFININEAENHKFAKHSGVYEQSGIDTQSKNKSMIDEDDQELG